MSGESNWDEAMRRGFAAGAPPETLADGTCEVDTQPPDVSARYEILGPVGHGGVGVVYRARDKELGRDVAVNVLHADLQDGMAERFFEEAQIGAQLQHPGIVPVYDLEFGAARPYFTMKLIEGRTLLDLLAERPDAAHDRLRFLRHFEKICDTIAYAHARGVVHRDLKSANVMVGEFGEVQTLDWGFAKVLGGDDVEHVPATVRSQGDSHASVVGRAIGTPAYMASEQALGDLEALDARTDVFCLGAILCEILTGEPPHRGGDSVTLLKKAACGDLDDAHARIDACGAEHELAELAKRCLQAKKSDRPANAGELAASVGSYLASIEQRARAAELSAAEERARAAHERKARRLTLVLAGVAVISIAVGLFVYWQRAERLRDNDREVQSLLRIAALHAQQRDWSQAQATLQQAQTRVEASRVSPAIAQSVRARSASIDALARIYAIRYEDDIEPAAVDNAYTAAFRDLGIDVTTLDAKTIGSAVVADHGAMRDELALALDDWASRLTSLDGEVNPRAAPDKSTLVQWRKLVGAANGADTDAWRRSLRRAALASNRAELDRLATEIRTEPHSPESVVLLYHALQHAQRGQERAERSGSAFEVLQAGFEHHPGDFWINFLLARDASRGRFGRGVDMAAAVRHAGIAVALRPGNAEARAAFGIHLLRRARGRSQSPDDLAQARRQLEKAVELDARSVRARIGLAAALYAGGEKGRAEEIMAEVRKEHPKLASSLARMMRGPQKKRSDSRRR